MLQGLRTTIYKVKDLSAAKEWFTKVVGAKPYFDEPFYVGFNVGGYELGLVPSDSDDLGGASALAYWGVPNATTAVADLVKLGAAVVSEVKDVGGGIKVVAVRNPLGNEIGIIENPQFRPEH